MTTIAQTPLFALLSDIVDVRDLIERFEYLEAAMPDDAEEVKQWDDLGEYVALGDTLNDLKCLVGDEQWRGDWYPLTLIHDNNFTEYAKEMLEDCGTIPTNLPDWIEIDWDKTAHNIQQDYTSIEISGHTYWTR
jgi:hypothetical protein